MTETKAVERTEETKKARGATAPTHTAYRIDKNEDGEDKWVKVGVAYWKWEKNQMYLYQDEMDKVVIMPSKREKKSA